MMHWIHLNIYKAIVSSSSSCALLMLLFQIITTNCGLSVCTTLDWFDFKLNDQKGLETRITLDVYRGQGYCLFVHVWQYVALILKNIIGQSHQNFAAVCFCCCWHILFHIYIYQVPERSRSYNINWTGRSWHMHALHVPHLPPIYEKSKSWREKLLLVLF